jgi:ComF family protein
VCRDLLGGGAQDVVCARCWARLRLLPSPRCDRCGHPVPALELAESHLHPGENNQGVAASRCSWCALLPPYVRAARSVCWATVGSGGELVHALKYEGWTRLAAPLAVRMGRLSWPRDVVEERSALVPVPLSPLKLRERGFNQSLLLAATVGRIWGIEVWPDVLQRVRATRTQTRLTPDAREANVAGAFAIADSVAEKLRGTHLVLVDDVVTTCATMNACAAALYDAGARLTSYLTFGRAPMAADRV